MSKRNMKQWLSDMITAPVKKAMPVLSFPSSQLLGITVKELIQNSDMQSRGMKAIADRVDSAASLSLMDLSLEAHAFGSSIHISDDEVPTVVGRIIENPEDAEALQVPKVGAGRTGIYVESIQKAVSLITDRPVFAGMIGPYSLAGRLMDVSEIMINCYEEPEMVHTTMAKCTDFLIEYGRAYKAAGANGIVLAEPLTGLLSPSLCGEFSSPYVKRICDALQEDDFIIIYHNCGNETLSLTKEILSTGSAAYHFGNAIDLSAMLKLMPQDTVIMGNVDPARQFRNGTPESIREETLRIMDACCKHSNFVISSGCDIPPASPWENIDAFFDAVAEYYQNQK